VPERDEEKTAELREECRLFLEHLHPPDSWGVVTVFSRPEERQRRYRPRTLRAAAAAFVGKEDLYVSVNRFRGRRGDGRLLVLGSLFVDLDYHRSADPEVATAPPHEALMRALTLLSRAGLPTPTTAVFTGRGLALYWRHSYLPARALPRWRACLKPLRDALAPLNPDPAVSDASRVMRLPGTRNSRGGRHARLLLTPGEPLDFEALAKAVLPRERHVIRRRKAPSPVETARAGRPARSSRGPVLDGRTLRRAKLEDLERLLRYRHPDGRLPPGKRDPWLFAASTLLAFLVPVERLPAALVELAGRTAGWSESETLTRMHGTLKRAALAAAGRRDRRGERPVDPRYSPGRAWFVEALGISDLEMREAGLRVLVSAAVARERAALRQEGVRRQRGAVPRVGYLARAAGRRERAAALRRHGMSYSEIALRLETTAEAARKLVARAAAPFPVPDTSVTGNGGPSALPEGSGGGAPRPSLGDERETPLERPARRERCGKPAGFSKRAPRASACMPPARGNIQRRHHSLERSEDLLSRPDRQQFAGRTAHRLD